MLRPIPVLIAFSLAADVYFTAFGSFYDHFFIVDVILLVFVNFTECRCEFFFHSFFRALGELSQTRNSFFMLRNFLVFKRKFFIFIFFCTFFLESLLVECRTPWTDDLIMLWILCFHLWYLFYILGDLISFNFIIQWTCFLLKFHF